MSKKNITIVLVVLVIFSLSLAAFLPGIAFAGGNGNGNGQSQNGTSTQNQNCDQNCTGTSTQTNTSNGPGPSAQTNTSEGPGPSAQTNASNGPGPNAQVAAGYGKGNGSGNGALTGKAYRRGPGAQVGTGLALGPLSDAEVDALLQALQEEYAVQALYQHVIDLFGNVLPFSNIVVSEGQHISVLTSMATKYGVTIPSFTPGDLPEFTTLAEACQAGVEAEIADVALYDTLISVTTHTDLLQVYRNLQSASLNNHLPAFEACQ